MCRRDNFCRICSQLLQGESCLDVAIFKSAGFVIKLREDIFEEGSPGGEVAITSDLQQVDNMMKIYTRSQWKVGIGNDVSIVIDKSVLA
jgi:hypothetical protein